MKYIIKEPPYTGLTLDADSLMREFNRAMHVVYSDIDQNNVKDSQVSTSRIVSPVTSWETSTAVLGDSSAATGMHFAAQASGYSHDLDLPTNTFSGSTEARSVQSFWSFVGASAAEDLEFSITLNADTMGTLVATGQIAIGVGGTRGGARTCIFDTRLTDRGMPLDRVFTTSCEVDGGYLPFYLSVDKLFVAGQHVFKVHARDRCEPLDGADKSSITDTALYFYGFTR